MLKHETRFYSYYSAIVGLGFVPIHPFFLDKSISYDGDFCWCVGTTQGADMLGPSIQAVVVVRSEQKGG